MRQRFGKVWQRQDARKGTNRRPRWGRARDVTAKCGTAGRGHETFRVDVGLPTPTFRGRVEYWPPDPDRNLHDGWFETIDPSRR
jgi:hypothetical protein